MTISNSDPGPEPGSRFPGKGFRVEPEFRNATGAPEYVQRPELGHAASAATPASEAATARVLTTAELGDVFDDPEHGEPGRDRLGVHWMWETLLLIACVATALLLAGHAGALTGASIRGMMLSATVTGLLAIAAGVGLRAGAVNLAIGPIMVVSGLYFAQHAHEGFANAVVIALLLAIAAGFAIGLGTVVAQAPSWAVSLVAFFALEVVIGRLPMDVQLVKNYHAQHYAYYWYGAFALVAIVGAMLGMVHSIRRAVGRYRPVGDPADRRGVGAALMTVLALSTSGLLAGGAGIVLALVNREAITGSAITYTALGVAVALAGGTSAYGRRGGVFGSFLAASLYALLTYYVFDVAKLSVDRSAFLAGTLLLGVIVTRVVETHGRPRRGAAVEDGTSSWLRQQQGSWADQLPARTAEVGLDASGEWGRAPSR